METYRKKTAIEEKFQVLVCPIIEALGLKLYALEYISGGKLLRIYIDREGEPIQVEDCANVDRALTDPLNEHEWIPETLNLEVSSPGVYRPVRTLEHFQKSLGEFVCVKLKQSVKQESFKGNKLRGLLADVFEQGIQLKSADEQETLAIQFDNINEVFLDPDLNMRP